MGDGDRQLILQRKQLETTEIPVTQFLPTHSRNTKLFTKSIEYAKKGGFVDYAQSPE